MNDEFFAKAQAHARDGYISIRKHPLLDLFIYNYTNKCQFDNLWDPITLQCRGLILDSGGRIVARPFPKFFNIEQHPRSDIRWRKPFTVTEKLDGSLGILYPERPFHAAVATRGSFESDQAFEGTQILYQFYSPWIESLWNDDAMRVGEQRFTHLFEIIYPQNRIVVDYQGVRDLYLLAIIDNETGRDVDLATTLWPGPTVKQHDATALKPHKVADILGLDDGNNEGFVLRFDLGHEHWRVKVKLDEYKRLHKLLTGINNRRIWETLAAGGDLQEVYDRVPDEFYGWVKGVVAALWSQYEAIEDRATQVFTALSSCPDRKTFAIEAQNFTLLPYPTKAFQGILFMMLDKRDYSGLIWKMIRPEVAESFRTDIDAG